jgi:hypothetical protein
MQVKYSTTWLGSTADTTDGIAYWVEQNLRYQQIGPQMEMVCSLLGILTERHLEKFPEDVEKIASAIHCRGWKHSIAGDDCGH